MIKHKTNKNYTYKGTSYISANGILLLPIEVKALNPVVEEKKVDTEKEDLIAKAVVLGLGAESTLKRNSVETLKKKIEEAE